MKVVRQYRSDPERQVEALLLLLRGSREFPLVTAEGATTRSKADQLPSESKSRPSEVSAIDGSASPRS
jgi:hypothetical protein